MSRVRNTLVLGRVIGDVLDSFTRSVSLRVFYNSREVINGSDFRPSYVTHQPRVEIGGVDLGTFYTRVNPLFILYDTLFVLSNLKKN